jgi:hypothetical protein
MSKKKALVSLINNLLQRSQPSLYKATTLKIPSMTINEETLPALDFIKVIAYVKYLLLDRFLH